MDGRTQHIVYLLTRVGKWLEFRVWVECARGWCEASDWARQPLTRRGTGRRNGVVIKPLVLDVARSTGEEAITTGKQNGHQNPCTTCAGDNRTECDNRAQVVVLKGVERDNRVLGGVFRGAITGYRGWSKNRKWLVGQELRAITKQLSVLPPALSVIARRQGSGSQVNAAKGFRRIAGRLGVVECDNQCREGVWPGYTSPWAARGRGLGLTVEGRGLSRANAHAFCFITISSPASGPARRSCDTQSLRASAGRD